MINISLSIMEFMVSMSMSLGEFRVILPHCLLLNSSPISLFLMLPFSPYFCTSENNFSSNSEEICIVLGLI